MDNTVLCIAVNNYKENFSYYLKELHNLIGAYGDYEIEDIVQNLDKADSSYYIGPGKIKEIEKKYKFIVTLDELTPRQHRNLEKELDSIVKDRTQLILDIFASRAKSREAKLQVEIAKLKYSLPKISGSYEGLSRQGGGSSGTITRGSGEQKIEIDKRRIKNDISKKEEELDSLIKSREQQRKNRKKSSKKIVSLVGYTNAGKSTIMNKFTVDEDKKVFEKDMLFATLDTSVRDIKQDSNPDFLLVDTVGFVSNLPHELVKAFRSTLEEIVESDLILEILDISDPEYKNHKQIIDDILKSLNAHNIPREIIYNKADMINHLEIFPENLISAQSDDGIRHLKYIINENLFSHYKEYELIIPLNRGDLINKVYDNFTIRAFETKNDYIFKVITSDDHFNNFKTKYNLN